MLRRLGNKSKLLPQLLPLFPENITTFIDMFMGSGAVTFAMLGKVKYIFANDNDEEVFNLFMVIKDHPETLLSSINLMPYHEGVFKHWQNTTEHSPVWKATRFLMLSNCGLFGQSDTLRFVPPSQDKKALIRNLEKLPMLHDIKFMQCDFRDVISNIQLRAFNCFEKAFVYADPPYLGTGNNYAESFTEDDTRDLFSILTSSGIRFALSEFRHPLVMALAEEHGLHVTSLGERRNLKNRREEILITNYNPVQRQMTIFDITEGAPE